MRPKGPSSRLFGALHRRNRAPVAVPLDLCCRPTAPPLQGNGAPVAAQSGPRCARFGLRFSAPTATVPPKPLKHNHLHKPPQNSKIRARTNRARFFSNLSQVRAIIFSAAQFLFVPLRQSREITPSRQKKNKIFCFALDFS